MAQDDDPMDDLRSVSMTTAAAASRTAETVIRAMQDRARRDQAQTQASTHADEARYQAQAEAARRFYDTTLKDDWVRRADPAEVVKAWSGAQQWSDIDRETFKPYADRLNGAVHDAYGVDLAKGSERAGGVEAAEQTIAQRQGGDTGRGGTAEHETLEQRIATKEAEIANLHSQFSPHMGARGLPRSKRELLVEAVRERQSQLGDLVAERDARPAQSAQPTANAENNAQAAAPTDPDPSDTPDYDCEQARSQRDVQLRDGEVTEETRDAVMTADHLNGTDPQQAAASAAKGQRGKVTSKKPKAREKSKSAARGR